MQDQLWNAGPVKITPSRRRTYPSEGGLCREPGCTNRARAKQGARYCADHARSDDYGPINQEQAAKEQAICAGCHKPYRRWKHLPKSPTAQAWREFCAECHRESPLNSKRLVHHNVPFEMAHGWLMQGGDLRCDLCERRLSRKSAIAQPTIDHDHHCCDRDKSCGECIRGILCVRCNTWLGAYEQMVRTFSAERIAAYLQPDF